MASGTVLNILTKAVGAGAIGMVLYDSHEAGKIRSSAYEKNSKSESLSQAYLDDLKLDSPSTIRSHAKKGIFHYKLDENLSSFFTSVGGYFKGFNAMLVRDVIPFGLALGTFIGSKGPRGVISKVCGLGLLAYGGIFLLQEGFGIGKHKD